MKHLTIERAIHSYQNCNIAVICKGDEKSVYLERSESSKTPVKDRVNTLIKTLPESVLRTYALVLNFKKHRLIYSLCAEKDYTKLLNIPNIELCQYMQSTGQYHPVLKSEPTPLFKKLYW